MKTVRFLLLSVFFLSFSSLHSVETGKASFYHKKFIGKRTASGAVYRADDLICAHRSHPFGTEIYVVNKSNNKRVKVKVVDRGPFSKGRVIDVSYAAAERLGFIRKGVCMVEIHPVIDSLEYLPISTLIEVKPLEIKKSINIKNNLQLLDVSNKKQIKN